MRVPLLIAVLLTIFSNIHAQLSCSMTTPCTPLTGGQAYQKPIQVVSQEGHMTTSLVVDIAEKKIDWLQTQRRLYNGTFPGPTIRIKPGDIIELNLINNLQEPDYAAPSMNVFSHPNTTNLHTHGLHISSKVPQDNVFVIVAPEQYFQYRYEINSHQPAGTYWYHPHLHGSGYFQVLSGMAGMLIVQDDPSSMSDELNAVSCPNNCENDLEMTLQLFQYSSAEDGDFASVQRDIGDYDGFRLNNNFIANSTQTLEEWLEEPANHILYTLVNGFLQPNLSMESGKAKRFRLLNAGGLYAYALKIVNTNTSGPGCDVKEIALDGIYLDKPRDVRLGRSLLVASARVDWIVICPSAGTYELQSIFEQEDTRSLGEHPSFQGTLLSITVVDTDANDAFPVTLPIRPKILQDLRNVPSEEIGGRFAVEVTPTDTLNREDFVEQNIRYKAEVNTVQEWFFTNTEYVTSHPIHVHVNSFQVISYNPYTGPYGVDDGGSNWELFGQNETACTYQHRNYNPSLSIESPPNPLEYLGHDKIQPVGGPGTIGYAVVGEFRDTLLVPPLSNITVRFLADEYTGEVVVHCHLLADSDQGMMMNTEIVEKGVSLMANLTSGGAYPWSCFKNEPLFQNPGGAGSHIFFSYSLVSLLVLVSLVFTVNQ